MIMLDRALVISVAFAASAFILAAVSYSFYRWSLRRKSRVRTVSPSRELSGTLHDLGLNLMGADAKRLLDSRFDFRAEVDSLVLDFRGGKVDDENAEVSQ